MIPKPTLHASMLALALPGCRTIEPTSLDAARIDGSAPLDASTIDRPDAARREAGPLPDASRDRGDTDEAPREDLDGNTTWDEGPTLRPGEPPVTGRIDSSWDLDYLRIPATRGQYLAILLRPPPSCESPVLCGLPNATGVYDRERRFIVPFTESTDCDGRNFVEDVEIEAVFRVPESGTYYVELSSFFLQENDWAVEVVDLATSENTLVVNEGEPAVLTAAHRCVVGAFETADDIDDVAFDAATPRLIEVLPPSFHGSTGSARSVELRRGSTVLARSASETSRRVLAEASADATLYVAPPMSRGTDDQFLLRVSPLSLSIDPFFFYRFPFAEIRQREADDARNDEASGAELVRLGCPRSDVGVLCPGDTAGYCRCSSDAECGDAGFSCAAPPAGTPGSGDTCRTTSTPSSCTGAPGTRSDKYAPQVLVLALPPGDVDHFAIDVDGSVYNGTGILDVTCGGATFGSSVRDLEISVFDPAGSLLLTRFESAVTGAASLRLGAYGSTDLPLSDGRYVLRVRAGRYEAGVDGHVVACAITSGPHLSRS